MVELYPDHPQDPGSSQEWGLPEPAMQDIAIVPWGNTGDTPQTELIVPIVAHEDRGKPATPEGDNDDAAVAARLQIRRLSIGYPNVPIPVIRDWSKIPNEYTAVEYTAESVKRAVPDWEDPDLEAVLERAQRLSSCPVLLRDKATGRPLNPAGATGVSGYGRLRHLGPNLSADTLVTNADKVLLIQRRDTGQFAFPGGFRKQLPDGTYEDPLEAAIRETYEETDVTPLGEATLVYSGVARWSLKNTDNAWVENNSYHIDTSGASSLPVPHAKDDARSAAWFPVFDIDLSLMSDAHAENVIRLQNRMRQQS